MIPPSPTAVTRAAASNPSANGAAEAIQLAAELLYVELLGENDTGGDLKEHVNHVLGLVPRTTPMAKNIRQALHAGRVARYGAGKATATRSCAFLVQFVLA